MTIPNVFGYLGLAAAILLPSMGMGAAVPSSLSTRNVATTYTALWTATLNNNGQGDDHGGISQKVIEHNGHSEHAVVAHFYLRPYFNKATPCSLQLTLGGTAQSKEWAVGNSIKAINNVILRITPLQGEIDPATASVGNYSGAKLGKPWANTILGIVDETGKFLAEPVDGLCEPGNNTFLLQVVEDRGMYVWWMENEQPSANGLKLQFQ